MRRVLATGGLALALLLAAIVVCDLASAPASAPAQQATVTATATAAGGAAARGRGLFIEGCASCHGLDGRGVSGRGPSLRGVGRAALDFYLATGRMPLARPGIEPARTEPLYDRRGRADLIAYITGWASGGLSIPTVDLQRADIARGRRLFADLCSGCHQIAAKGGVDPVITAPPLDDATPVQIAEAIRIGPYLMPRFGPDTLDARDIDSIARYVTAYGRHPVNRGGWGIGNVGPIPEGLVAWLLGAGSLLLVARVIGKRTR